jgi:hypothetical protein
MAAANRIVFRTGFSEPMRISTTPGTTPAKDEIAEILIFGQENTFLTRRKFDDIHVA